MFFLLILLIAYYFCFGIRESLISIDESFDSAQENQSQGLGTSLTKILLKFSLWVISIFTINFR